ncbi:Helix-loop-helix protein delilah [Portunus trituberculatus]|uniref:Helix-loop-helix protein delilah n=1 Tax=Portunus trituberculatus TaxID=210409 RepID=A0A5B7IDT0_PORTR|nr:Helix-loop-helix protein delilah [Portunus trituberculatus]
MAVRVMTGKTFRSGEPRMRQDSGHGSPSRGKYSLRPRTARRLQQDRVQDVYIESGPKSKAPPLSKYRRKTANARERYRMRKINSAFDSLRSILPAALAVKPTSSSLTKITTLRLAVRYIRALSEVLEGGDAPALYSMGSSLDTLQTSAQESLQLSSHFPLQEITFSSVSQWTSPWKTQLPLQSSSCTVSSVAPCCCSSSSSSSPSSSSASSINTSPAPPSREPPACPRHHEAATLLDFKMQDSFTYLHQIESLSSCDDFDVL